MKPFDLSFFSQMNLICGLASPFVFLRCITLSCCIYILVSQYVGDEIDVTCFLIQRCSIGTS